MFELVIVGLFVLNSVESYRVYSNGDVFQWNVETMKQYFQNFQKRY